MVSEITAIKEKFFDLQVIIKEYTDYKKQLSIGYAAEEKKKVQNIFDKCRQALQEELPYWYHRIASNVTHSLETNEMDTWTRETFNNTFSVIIEFFKGSKNDQSVYYKLQGSRDIIQSFENLKPYIWEICAILEIISPEIIELEKTMDIQFALRDNGFENVTESLEEIENKKSGLEKCSVARSALEKLLKEILQKEGQAPAQGFYSNLDKIKKLTVIEKEDRKTIGAHYSFISKIIHQEKKDDSQNVLYSINGIYIHIEYILKKYQSFREKLKS